MRHLFKHLLLFSTILISILLSSVSTHAQMNGKGDDIQFTRVCIRHHCFHVEVADEAPERYLGLMFRKTVPLDSGMLFVYDSTEARKFWMKNTYIPLDIIWVDANKRIVGIQNNAAPCVEEGAECPLYESKRPIKYVLEINGGLSKKYNLRVGDTLRFQDLIQISSQYTR